MLVVPQKGPLMRVIVFLLKLVIKMAIRLNIGLIGEMALTLVGVHQMEFLLGHL